MELRVEHPEFAPVQIHQTGQYSYAASHGSDASLIVEFSMVAVKHEAESLAAGRPIHKETPHIRISFPGDRTREVVRPVKLTSDEISPSDPERFPRQWAAFQNSRTVGHEGTLLEHWGALNRAQVADFKALNIHTVEQFASLPDGALQMGMREIREKARAFLAAASDRGHAAELVERVAALELDNQALREQLAAMQALYGAEDDEPAPVAPARKRRSA